MLKQQREQEKLAYTARHNELHATREIRAIEKHTAKINLSKEILEARMKLADINVQRTLGEKITMSQRLGTERVQQAKERVKQAKESGDDDIQRAIELSLQQLKQDQAKAKRDEINQSKIAKAKDAYTSTLMTCVVEKDLSSGEIGQKAKALGVQKKVSQLAEKIQKKHE